MNEERKKRAVSPTTSEQREARLLVRSAFALAHELGIGAVLIQADEMSDVRLIQKMETANRLIWLVQSEDFVPPKDLPGKQIVLPIPDTGLSRMSQIKMGLFLAIFNGYIEIEESVLCVCGVAGSERLDTILIANPKRDFPWLRKTKLSPREPLLSTKTFARIVDIALRIAAEGREGRPVGTAFVLGSRKELRPYLRQLVLNPFAGHRASRRSIFQESMLDTVREFAALDGAFVVNRGGTLVSAGTYLDASSSVKVSSGLGARHRAAAAITAVTQSVAVVISSSSRHVTVFHKGQLLIELQEAEEK